MQTRVGIERSIESGASRLFDQLNDALEGAGRAAPARDDVGDLQSRLAGPGDPYALLDGLGRVDVLVALVGGVEGPCPRHNPTQLGGLVLRRGALQRVLQPVRVAVRPRLQALLQHHAHAPHLVGRGRSAGVGHGGQPEVAVGHEGRDVDGGPGGFEPVEVLGHGGPVDLDDGIVAVDVGREAVGLGDGRAAVAAVADELGRDALGDGALGTGIDEQGVVGVAVDVDEAGGDDHARCVEAALRLGGAQVADRDDPAVLDAYVSGDSGRAGAVHDGAAADYEVNHAGVPSGSQMSVLNLLCRSENE